MNIRRPSALAVMTLSGVLLLAAFAAPVAAQTRARQLESLALFELHAEPPTDRIRSFRLTDWRPLGPRHLAVFRGPVNAWLIQVRDGCVGLDWARSVALTSSSGIVMARFDRVQFRDGPGPRARKEQCRIETIRPVDYRKVREARRAQGASDEG
jgi:hypothetical protein